MHFRSREHHQGGYYLIKICTWNVKKGCLSWPEVHGNKCNRTISWLCLFVYYWLVQKTSKMWVCGINYQIDCFYRKYAQLHCMLLLSNQLSWRLYVLMELPLLYFCQKNKWLLQCSKQYISNWEGFWDTFTLDQRFPEEKDIQAMGGNLWSILTTLFKQIRPIRLPHSTCGIQFDWQVAKYVSTVTIEKLVVVPHVHCRSHAQQILL